ncbi:hypothetical protein ABZ543_24975 [Streptomyces roseifaciens]
MSDESAPATFPAAIRLPSSIRLPGERLMRIVEAVLDRHSAPKAAP